MQNPEPSAPPFDEDVVAKALAEYKYPDDKEMTLFLAKTANGIQLEWEQDGIRYRAVESTKKTHNVLMTPGNIPVFGVEKDYSKELFSQAQTTQSKQPCGPDHPASDGQGSVDRDKEFRRIRGRKIKKALGWTSWVVLFPVMVVVQAIRDGPTDDEDLKDDPLRPWSYDIHYLYPHERDNGNEVGL